MQPWSFQVWVAIKVYCRGGSHRRHRRHRSLRDGPLEESRLRAQGARFCFIIIFIYIFIYIFFPTCTPPCDTACACANHSDSNCLLQLVIFHPGVLMIYNLLLWHRPPFYIVSSFFFFLIRKVIKSTEMCVPCCKTCSLF